MREISVGGLFRLFAPAESSWSMDHDKSALIIKPDDISNIAIIYLLKIDTKRDRKTECKLVLEEHIRDVIGPPYQTNVISISGSTWTGWQAVTAIGASKFVVNRCISGEHTDLLLRIEFKTGATPAPALLQIVESIEIM